MTTIFGKETFEGGSLPASFTSQSNSGGATGVIDGTSKVTGTYSMKMSATASGSSVLIKNLGTDYSELWVQFKVFIPTAFAFGASTTVIPLHFNDSGAATVIEMKFEDYGTQEITLQGGTLGYTDTTLTVTKNVVHKIEFYYKVSATVGAWKIWIDNDVAGSPNASGSSLNTGTALLRTLNFGNSFSAAAFTDSVYLDEVVVSDAFIGAGTTSPTNLFFAMMN